MESQAGELLTRLTRHSNPFVRLIFYGIGIAILLGAAAWAAIEIGDLIARLSPHVADLLSAISKSEVPQNVAQPITGLLLGLLVVVAVVIWRRIEDIRHYGTAVGKTAMAEIARLDSQIQLMQKRVDHLVEHHNADVVPLPKFMTDAIDDISKFVHRGRDR